MSSETYFELGSLFVIGARKRFRLSGVILGNFATILSLSLESFWKTLGILLSAFWKSFWATSGVFLLTILVSLWATLGILFSELSDSYQTILEKEMVSSLKIVTIGPNINFALNFQLKNYQFDFWLLRYKCILFEVKFEIFDRHIEEFSISLWGVLNCTNESNEKPEKSYRVKCKRPKLKLEIFHLPLDMFESQCGADIKYPIPLF